MKKVFVIHPFLFGIFPIIYLFAHNSAENVAPSELLLAVGMVLGVTFVLFVLLSLVIKNTLKAGIILSIFIFLFFSYGHTFIVLSNYSVCRHRYLFLIFGICLTCCTYMTIRTQRKLSRGTNMLNVIACFLVMVSLVNIGVYKLKTKGILKSYNRGTAASEIERTQSEKTITPRDIYYIILDGYASESTLKEIYGYDNRDFLEYLTGKGFYIASKGRSNYPSTFLSLSSSLNMQYVNNLTDVVGADSNDKRIPYQMIRNNKIMNFIKSRGYRYVNFCSGWSPTDYNDYADINFRLTRGNEFFLVLAQTTMLRPFADELYFNEEARKKTLYTFDRLAQVHSIDFPKFVFAHIALPHPPYIFGAEGEPVSEMDYQMSGGAWKHKDLYVNQLIFINKKVKKLIDDILSKSAVPPIIVLQADHGSASTLPSLDIDNVDGIDKWALPSDINLSERMTIFNAYYLPIEGDQHLYPSITPVNTFRLIFNTLFHTSYELLDDQSYYSTYDHPYKFMNVTDRIINYKKNHRNN